MITVKKSTDGFCSYSETRATAKEARKELADELTNMGRTVSNKGGKPRNAVLRLTLRQKGRGPILTWIFEGSEEEINELLITRLD